jgi:hypothetical protein
METLCESRDPKWFIIYDDILDQVLNKLSTTRVSKGMKTSFRFFLSNYKNVLLQKMSGKKIFLKLETKVKKSLATKKAIWAEVSSLWDDVKINS